MKKTFLGLALALMGLGLQAQTTQGSLTLGGSIGYNSTKEKNNYLNSDYESSYFQFSPNVGYFVVDNLEVGLNLGISFGKAGYEILDPTKTTTFSAGPYARYYKFTSNERFAFTGALGVSFGSGKSSTETTESKTSNFGVSIAPGFVYFLTDKWGLDFQLEGIGFSSLDPNKDVDDDNRNVFSFGLSSLSPSLGFRYYIAK